MAYNTKTTPLKVRDIEVNHTGNDRYRLNDLQALDYQRHKRPVDWKRRRKAKDFLANLSRSTGKPWKELIYTLPTGTFAVSAVMVEYAEWMLSGLGREVREAVEAVEGLAPPAESAPPAKPKPTPSGPVVVEGHTISLEKARTFKALGLSRSDIARSIEKPGGSPV